MGDYRPKLEQRILRGLIRISALLLVVLFQTALAPSIWRLRVDWMLVIVISWTLLAGLGSGLHWAIIGGIALDLLTPLPIGSHLLAMLLAVLAATVLTEALPREQRLVATATIILVSVLYGFVLALIMSFTGLPIVWDRYPFTILMPAALANGAAAIPAFYVLERFHRGGRPRISFET
jgi:rod shape-determining protein MreD